jgi:hypothetical protein
MRRFGAGNHGVADRVVVGGGMSKHLPSVIWAVKKIGHYPNAYVMTTADGGVRLEYFHDMGERGFSLEMPRGYARLLARRINQCLEETK